MFANLWNWIVANKKATLILVLTFVLGGLQAVGVPLPSWLIVALAGIGVSSAHAEAAKQGAACRRCRREAGDGFEDIRDLPQIGHLPLASF